MATLIPFSQYQVMYYSQSSNPAEAAYIECFDSSDYQTGSIRFVYDSETLPANQLNNGNGVMVLYYHLGRFDDVINLLRYSLKGDEPVWLSLDYSSGQEVAAIVNNLRVPVGSQGCCSKTITTKRAVQGTDDKQGRS